MYGTIGVLVGIVIGSLRVRAIISDALRNWLYDHASAVAARVAKTRDDERIFVFIAASTDEQMCRACENFAPSASRVEGSRPGGRQTGPQHAETE